VTATCWAESKHTNSVGRGGPIYVFAAVHPRCERRSNAAEKQAIRSRTAILFAGWPGNLDQYGVGRHRCPSSATVTETCRVLFLVQRSNARRDRRCGALQ